MATPVEVYRVLGESPADSRLETKTTLTPLVGRDEEVGFLFKRWEQAKEGRGQVVLLGGEPGIGKSRLWQQQGRKADARRMLAEICDWFTEGFDTADLKEARVLLEELKKS